MTRAVSSSRATTYSAASPADIVHPKSTTHLPAGRRVTSMPFTHGLSTLAFVRLFGSSGSQSPPHA